ncbi:hypothetical protein [Citrobacter portucalensis]|uniref:hypothetical protein n=1 Tax=Citrobacter portucalensis TaxID=1639133 RepID=UPI00254B7860|nr:hypothetical protein [Citrobacter portucalensis]
MEYIKKHFDEIRSSYIKHLIDIMTTSESVGETNKAYQTLLDMTIANLENNDGI